MKSSLVAWSKFLSLVLRHKPGSIGIALDPAGFVAVDTLLAACASHGRPLTRAELEQVVQQNSKQRFAFSADGLMIRASQGHSVPVQLDHAACAPPEVLYHGTVQRFLADIRSQGLCKQARHHVHLSPSRQEAEAVGARRGVAVVLEVRAAAMASQGFVFFRSPNGVWLTDEVPPDFLVFPEELGR